VRAVRVRHVILDRDGVLNREAPGAGYILAPQQFEWLPGALEALGRMHAAGLRLSVVTNQSAVGRGLMSLAALHAVHARMRAEAAARGAPLDAILFCPHAPEAACACRKPSPALLAEAVARSGIAAAETLAVGDDRRDLEAAQRAGVPAALVRTGKGRETERAGGSALAVAVYEDLAALAQAVTAGAAQ